MNQVGGANINRWNNRVSLGWAAAEGFKQGYEYKLTGLTTGECPHVVKDRFDSKIIIRETIQTRLLDHRDLSVSNRGWQPFFPTKCIYIYVVYKRVCVCIQCVYSM